MLHEPFRGSDAVAAGALTRGALRGPRFQRLFHDVYVAAGVEPDLALRSRAAHLLLAGRGVLGGWSAAELLGASCAARDAPAEVIVRGRLAGCHHGLLVRRDRLAPGEVTEIDGIPVTSPLRTAFDLARRPPLTEAVVAVDALAHRHHLDVSELRRVRHRHLGARGSAQLPHVLALANPLAESPMETRIRLAIVNDGLPAPVLQHPVGPYRLDMAYPAIRLGIECDGREHLDQARALRDLDRQSYLATAGWTRVLRFPAAEVFHPGGVAARVHQELLRYGRRHDLFLRQVLALIDPNGT